METLLNYFFNSLPEDLFEKMFEIENGILKTSKLCDLCVAFVCVSFATTLVKLFEVK